MPALESFMYIEAIFNLYSISVCELAKSDAPKSVQKRKKKAWSIAQGSPFES